MEVCCTQASCVQKTQITGGLELNMVSSEDQSVSGTSDIQRTIHRDIFL